LFQHPIPAGRNNLVFLIVGVLCPRTHRPAAFWFVEVLAMGTRDQLAGLRSRLREGPRAARVDDVEESEAKPVADLTSFRIEGAW
jgi:hypothetical protein